MSSCKATAKRRFTERCLWPVLPISRPRAAWNSKQTRGLGLWITAPVFYLGKQNAKQTAKQNGKQTDKQNAKQNGKQTTKGRKRFIGTPDESALNGLWTKLKLVDLGALNMDDFRQERAT